MKTISVFGGTGFVGSRFCALTQNEVIKVPREERRPQSPESLFLISTTHNYNVFEDIHKDVDVNLTVLLEVLKNLKAGESTFNFISSWFVYGDTALPAREDSPCEPKGFYSITKLAAEQLVKSYCETFKIDYRILRLCNIYGKGDKGVSAKKNALQFLCNKLAGNEEIGLYHGGDFLRDYLHVDDAVRAIDLCIEKAPVNETINIGSGEKVVFKDLIETAYKKLDSQSEIKTIEPPEFHKIVQVKDFYMDSSKLKSLGFKPSISLAEGIESLCQ